MHHSLIISLLANCTANDTVVHISPLMPRAATPYPACAARLVLASPDGEVIAALREDLGDRQDVAILNAAILEPNACSVLNRYALDEFNGFRAPTGLLHIYPGLQREGTAPVTARAAADLVASMPCDSKNSDLLIIQMPGEEKEILAGLAQVDALTRFGQVVFDIGRHPLFEGSDSAANMCEWLTKRGFDFVEEIATDEPEILTLYAKRNPLRAILNDTLTMLAELEKETALAASANASELETLQDIQAALQADLAAANIALGKEVSRMQELVAEKDDAVQKAAALRAQTQADETALEILRRDLATAQVAASVDATVAQNAANSEATAALLRSREEMASASAQIALIQDLLLSGDQL